MCCCVVCLLVSPSATVVTRSCHRLIVCHQLTSRCRYYTPQPVHLRGFSSHRDPIRGTVRPNYMHRSKRYLILSPAKRRDIVLSLSVCPSVRHALFLFCALIDYEAMKPTIMKPIPYESWGSGLCHRGSVFPCPPKFWRDRPLKTAENHIFQFLEL